MPKSNGWSSGVLGILLVGCGGATATADQPAQPHQPAPAFERVPTHSEPAAAEPVVATATAQKEELPADGSVEQVVFDAVRLVIRATPVSIGESYGLQLDVTATTDSNREAWLFGMRDGLTMSGSFGHIATGGAGGGKFSEGGSASSVHVKGTLPRDMKRAYPRSSEPPIRPGSTLNVSLKTSICPQKTHGSSCREREIASVVLTVGASGVPTVRIKPGAAP